MVRHHGCIGYEQKKSPVLRDFPDFIFLLQEQKPASPLRESVKVKTAKKPIIVLVLLHSQNH